MVNSNLRFVISQARRFQGQGLPMGDLVQEGMLGLIRAVEKFDWRKGFKFSTYAVLWIKQSIQRGLSNSGTTIRIPVHIGQRERKVKKNERELAVKLGRQPTDAEIAEATALPEDQVREALELTKNLASLDQAVSEDGDTALGDLLPSERPQPEEEVVDALGNARVRELVGELPDEERNLVTLRFGLAGDEPASLREAGTQLGLSTQVTRRLEARRSGAWPRARSLRSYAKLRSSGLVVPAAHRVADPSPSTASTTRSQKPGASSSIATFAFGARPRMPKRSQTVAPRVWVPWSSTAICASSQRTSAGSIRRATATGSWTGGAGRPQISR